MYKASIKLWTVADLEANRELIDCNPVHQRLERHSGKNNHEKSQGIISAMMEGMGIGIITMHKTPDGEFEFESIDGGHRKRAILGFLNGEFKVKDKLFRDMTSKERDSFRKIVIPFCEYENLSGPEVGKLFRTLNKTTQVNHQENLNSYGNTPIANAVRGTVREVSGSDSTPHAFFSSVIKDNKVVYDYIDKKFTNEGLAQEEWIARLFYLYYKGGKITQCTDKNLEEMYDANPPQDVVDKLQAKINELLKFVQKMSNFRNQRVAGSKRMTVMEANLFIRLHFYMTEKYGKFSFSTVSGKTDSDFFFAVWTAHTLLADKNTTNQKLKDISPFDARKTVGGQYCSSLTEYKYKKEVIMYPIDLLLTIGGIDVEKFLVIKDKKRTYSVEEREVAFAKQGGLDAITGEEITMSTSEGDHIVPHAKGGKTVPENLAMIGTARNRQKSATSMEDFKASLNKE